MARQYTKKAPRITRKEVAQIAKKTVLKAAESKYNDQTWSTPLDTAGSVKGYVVPVAEIPEGTSNVNRVGESCLVTSFDALLQMNKFNVTKSGWFRVSIVRQKQANNGQLAATDCPASMQGRWDRNKVQVLMDKRIAIDVNKQITYYEYKRKLNDKVQFSASGAGTAIKNVTYFYIWSDMATQTGGTACYPELQLRTYFRDI